MSEPTVLSEWFERRVRRTPDRPALTFDGVTWTYGRVWQEVIHMTRVFLGIGVSRDDRIVYVGLNDPLIFCALLAASRLGAAFVPLNYRLTSSEFAELLTDCSPRVVLADSPRESVLDRSRSSLALDCDYLGTSEDGNWTYWRDRPAPDGALPAVRGSDVATILYTSGTTGKPKGVVMTHDNHWWGAINGATSLEYGQAEVTMPMGPMFHVAGLCNSHWVLLRGGHVIAHREFAAEVVLADIERFRVTSLATVTALLLLLVNDPRFSETDLSSLRMIYCGGTPMPPEVLQRFSDRGVLVQGAYGSTESVPVMALLPAEHSMSKRLSVGRPAMFVDIRLVDDAGITVHEPRRRGEVWVQGPSISDRYWGEELTEATHYDGWLRTGDVGEWDEDGFLYLVDRTKDLIKSGGELISPQEVERILVDHPSVEEVAVVGAPHKRWGETAVAVVTLRPGSTLELSDLRKHAEQRLARFKLPTRLVIVDEFPRNASGKILKYQLREQIAS